MPDFMSQLRDYISTPLGLVVIVTSVLLMIALVVSMVLLWTAKPGSRNERLARSIMNPGALLAMPVVALASLPNLALAGLFMALFVFETWLLLSPGRRARNRRRDEALAALTRTSDEIKERRTEERAQAHAQELERLP